MLFLLVALALLGTQVQCADKGDLNLGLLVLLVLVLLVTVFVLPTLGSRSRSRSRSRTFMVFAASFGTRGFGAPFR